VVRAEARDETAAAAGVVHRTLTSLQLDRLRGGFAIILALGFSTQRTQRFAEDTEDSKK